MFMYLFSDNRVKLFFRGMKLTLLSVGIVPTRYAGVSGRAREGASVGLTSSIHSRDNRAREQGASGKTGDWVAL